MYICIYVENSDYPDYPKIKWNSASCFSLLGSMKGAWEPTSGGRLVFLFFVAPRFFWAAPQGIWLHQMPKRK